MATTFGNFYAKIRAFLAIYFYGTIALIKQTIAWSSLSNAKLPAILSSRVDNDKRRRPVALITGGTKGIGFELAKILAKDGFNLILVARNQSDGASAVELLSKLCPECKADFHSVDLSSLNEVKQFCSELKRKCNKLNLLINNAGLMMTPYKLVDGVEWQWATNVVAVVALCECLCDILEHGAQEDNLGRIVNVSSSAHFAQNLTINYIMNRQITADEYSSHLAYANSKLAVAMYTEDLQKRLSANGSKVIAVCLHPGVIVTDLYQHINPLMTAFTRPLSRSAADAAYDMRYMCFDENVKPGKYYENGHVTTPSFVNGDVRRVFKSYVDSLKRTL